MSTMLSFHNDAGVKAKYLERLADHHKHDRIVRGTGWKRGNGCAVGCTLNAYEHELYPIELGIPEWLGRLEGTLHEGMSAERALPEFPALTFAEQFLEAIPLGVSEGRFEREVKAPFLVFVLETVRGDLDHTKHRDALSAIDRVIALWRRPDIGSEAWSQEARAAWAAARAAAWAVPALSAAWEAAEASSGAAVAASSGAAVAASAEAARAAARAAAWAVPAAVAAARFDLFADELLRLLRALGEAERPQ